MMKKHLLVVDVQNDFLPGGSLAVPNGDEILPEIEKLIMTNGFESITFSRDWHPHDHTSFAGNHKVAPFTVVDGKMKWPAHCVANTSGSNIAKEIRDLIFTLPTIKTCIYNKGMDKNVEQYSAAGAYPNPVKDETIVVCGLATEICVMNTAIALKDMGWNVIVLLQCSRGLSKEKINSAVIAMKAIGIEIWD